MEIKESRAVTPEKTVVKVPSVPQENSPEIPQQPNNIEEEAQSPVKKFVENQTPLRTVKQLPQEKPKEE